MREFNYNSGIIERPIDGERIKTIQSSTEALLSQANQKKGNA